MLAINKHISRVEKLIKHYQTYENRKQAFMGRAI